MRLDSLPDKEKLKSALIENLELLAEIEHLRWNADAVYGWLEIRTRQEEPRPPHSHPAFVSWDETH